VPLSLNTWQLAGVILASAMLWMHYVQSKDRHRPEPRWRLLMAFALGIVACVLSTLSLEALEALGVPDIKFNERPWTAFYCFGIVGPFEEGTKGLLAYLIVFRWREFDEPLDGFVYAAALALGFACAENLWGTIEAGWLDQLASTVALPMPHVLFSAIWGFGIGYARFCVRRPSRRAFWQIGSIALAMIIHGLYDFLIFAYQARLAMSGLALALWVFVIWGTRQFGKLSIAHPAMPAQEKQDPPAPRV
jgi:RsiW-degrading membrane proteinase PrsW (M82 family)